MDFLHQKKNPLKDIVLLLFSISYTSFFLIAIIVAGDWVSLDFNNELKIRIMIGIGLAVLFWKFSVVQLFNFFESWFFQHSFFLFLVLANWEQKVYFFFEKKENVRFPVFSVIVFGSFLSKIIISSMFLPVKVLIVVCYPHFLGFLLIYLLQNPLDDKETNVVPSSFNNFNFLQILKLLKQLGIEKSLKPLVRVPYCYKKFENLYKVYCLKKKIKN